MKTLWHKKKSSVHGSGLFASANIKKGTKISVKKYLFRNKKRTSIQRASVNKALNLILSFTK